MDWPRPWYSILWAPWRMSYITNVVEKREGGCFLCESPKMGDDRKALIVYRGRQAFIILNRYPYNTGHLMVAPYRHVSSLEDLTDEELLEMIRLVKASMEALRQAYRPEGFNIGVNIGDVAGAGVPGHVHIHVVPRWKGDANYITVIGGTKVISQALEETYDLLRPKLEEAVRRYGLS
ncbi:MAG: HIT domain-containing protein [Acidilobus sp.]|jgi:ATP adenylyltransferase|nr:HIT domain-containing protein [Acidilobus sp.]